MDQSGVGRLGAGSKRKAAEPLDDLALGLGLGEGDSRELTDHDKAILSAFEDRLNELKRLAPPLADGPFKQYITDVVTQLGSINSELRIKKKSICRRALKDSDPLSVELEQFGKQLASFTHLLKCTWTEV